MDLHLDKDHGVGVGVGIDLLGREKRADPDKMQEKIKNIYKKKTSGSGYTKSILKTDVLPTIYEMSSPSTPAFPITFGSSLQREGLETEKDERKSGPIIEGLKSTQDMKSSAENTKNTEFNPFDIVSSLLPIKKMKDKLSSSFRELAKVIGYNDIQNNSLPPGKSLEKVWSENSAWLQYLIFEFFLVFFSYIITYNIYYYTFIYNWEQETAHFDPKQGFMFGGVLKSFMDDWLMRDIRYPMLFMGYLYSWLIPAFFNFIGVMPYPKLCFLIILLHTMIITFTQGPNAAMSVEGLIGGSPSILILALNLFSCLGAFFDTSMTVENAIAWARFVNMFLVSCVGNIIRLLIAFFGVFVSQIMVYFFFLYTTSGLGLLWEAKIVNIGDKIKQINDHISGKSGVGKNYCKAKPDTIGIWKFINEQVEPHFSWIFIYLLLLYIIVKTIATFFRYNGESAKLFLCYFLIILGITIWLIVTSVFGLGSANSDPLTTIVVSMDGNEPSTSMFDKIKEGVEGLSDYRKRSLTNLSNQGNNFLSKTVGQTTRNVRNALSDNVLSRTVLGDDTFTALDPETKNTLQNLTGQFNEMVTNVDSVANGGKEIEEVENAIKDDLSKQESLLRDILTQEKIKKFIENKTAKGKQIMDILSSMFQYMLSRAGANPKVSELGSKILAEKGKNLLQKSPDSNPVNLETAE